MEVINKIKIDLLKAGVKSIINAMQADENSRVLEITLNANGAAWEIPDGVSFSVAYKKPDGTRGLYDTMPDGTSASSVDGNVVSIRLAPQMLTAPGTVNTSVVISSGDQRISTFPIIVNVIQNPAVGAVGSEDYFYSSVIGNLDDLKTTDKTSVVAAINEIFSTGPGSNSGQNVTDAQIQKAVSDYLEKNPPIVSGSVNTVINQNGGGVLKIWAGTQSEYDALLVKNDDTVYLIDGATSSGGGGSEETTYTITKNLSNVTINNSASSVTAGSAYSATLTAADNHEISEVTVYMGGVDISATAYSNGVITIASVTGSIVITATATAVSGGGDSGDDSGTETSATIYTFTKLVQKRLDESGNQIDASGLMTDEFIPASGDAIALLSDGELADVSSVRCYGYDANQNYLGEIYTCAEPTVTPIAPVPINIENVAYIKVYWWIQSSSALESTDSLVYMRLLKGEYLTASGSLDSYGNVVAEAGMYTSDYMDVPDASKSYYVASSTKTVKIAWYDENKTFISREYKLRGCIKVTPPKNARYYRVSGDSDSCFSTLPVSGVS